METNISTLAEIGAKDREKQRERERGGESAKERLPICHTTYSYGCAKCSDVGRAPHTLVSVSAWRRRGFVGC